MGILSITTEFAGQTGVNPRIVRIVSTDNFSKITSENYLALSQRQGFTFLPTDFVAVAYGVDPVNVEWFTLDIESDSITLVPASQSTSGNVIADPGYLASFPPTPAKGSFRIQAVENTNDTVTTLSNAAMGQASDISIPDPGASTANVILNKTAGGSQTINDTLNVLLQMNVGTAAGFGGAVTLYSPDASKGSFSMIAADNASNWPVAMINRSFGQASNMFVPDPGSSTGTFALSSLSTPSPGGNFIPFNITVGFAALASAGSVTLIASIGSKQFRIWNLNMNKGGTNFSGGGGDRLGQVTDGTTVYSVIPATNLQTLVNSGWGISTPLPYPATAAIDTATAAGSSLVFKYSGGTADYTAGSVVISGLVERIA